MNTSPKFISDLNVDTSSISLCCKITLKNGDILGFTDYNDDLLIENINYSADISFTISAIDSNSTLTKSGGDISFALDENIIKTEDLINKKYDNAAIEIFFVNYNDVTSGKKIIKYGYFSDIKIYQNSFSVEIVDESEKLNKKIGRIISKTCRSELGDGRCKVDLSQYKLSSKIIGITDSYNIIIENLNKDNSYFNNGKVIFQSGENKGFTFNIKNHVAQKITFSFPIINMKIGDVFDIYPGCQKTSEYCNAKFNNIVNFNGEPFFGRDIKVVNS